ncbi:hypothetical protein [Dyadobacter bucti]|uniref:hypothetical protein n=1 Tax=Dyadobacter bucti TaxID=2572203 RepID=UPI0011086C07|nr:hypothetical protein [Dyadobacter bucti]
MNTLRIISLIFTIFSQFSCEDKFYKEKFDVKYAIINKTDSIIPTIKVNANNGAKVWVFKDVYPGKTEKLTFNIKRDLRTSEGSITLISSFNSKDSVYLGVAYYTNWYYLEKNPAAFNIYKDRIEQVK